MAASNEIKVGDFVTRWLAVEVPMKLRVTEITEDRILCGAWEFDRATGCEIDDYFDWGPPPKMTGSFIEIPGVEYVRKCR